MKKAIDNFDQVPICSRMKSTRIKLGFNDISKFSRHLGIKVTTYRNYEIDRMPSSEFLSILKAKFPHDVDIGWILTGHGADRPPMVRQPTPEYMAKGGFNILFHFQDPGRAARIIENLLEIEQVSPERFKNLEQFTQTRKKNRKKGRQP